jgi:hypothetical protein
MRKEIRFSLCGMAPVGGGRARWEWRRRLRDAGLVVHPSDPLAVLELRGLPHLPPPAVVRLEV